MVVTVPAAMARWTPSVAGVVMVPRGSRPREDREASLRLKRRLPQSGEIGRSARAELGLARRSQPVVADSRPIDLPDRTTIPRGRSRPPQVLSAHPVTEAPRLSVSAMVMIAWLVVCPAAPGAACRHTTSISSTASARCPRSMSRTLAVDLRELCRRAGVRSDDPHRGERFHRRARGLGNRSADDHLAARDRLCLSRRSNCDGSCFTSWPMSGAAI